MAGSMTEDGVKQGKMGPYQRCPICGHAYPETDFSRYKGKLYCKPNGCNKDIADLIKKGR